MNIFYQGITGAYSHQVAEYIKEKYNLQDYQIEGLFSFQDVFENLDKK
jgi:prephenate dehydratase